MDISHITTQSLFRLISLAEQKEELLGVLTEIDAEILRTLKEGQDVKVVEIAASPKTEVAAPAKSKASSPKPVKAGRSGGLKDKILALLDAAGPNGLRVKEIAGKLNVKATNISVWFSTTGKNLSTKVEPGRFAAKAAAASSKPAPAKPVEALVKAGKASPVSKPAKAGKASFGPKPAKAAKKGISPEGRARLAAAATARWAAVRAAKAAAKPSTPPAKIAKAPRKSKV